MSILIINLILESSAQGFFLLIGLLMVLFLLGGSMNESIRNCIGNHINDIKTYVSLNWKVSSEGFIVMVIIWW